MAAYINLNKELTAELNELINKHGFVQVLFILESFASENADIIGPHWEKIRENLESSMLEIEERLKLAEHLPENKIIAYEPVWAIGTGKVAEPEYIKRVAGYIADMQPNTRVLYGGSVGPNNIEAISAITNISGVLVGGASLDPDSLKKIIEAF